jgi:hypothetical protein
MNWLKSYLEYNAKQESPEKFQLWAGIAFLAACLGRNVWLDRRAGGVTRYQVFPGQLMIVLVGGSGVVRKTTTLGPVKSFSKYLGIKIVQGKTSAEAFLDELDPHKAGSPHALILEGELSVLLSRATYAEPLIDVLTKLADAEEDFLFNTRGGGKIVIPKPCITMLACTTPTSLGSSMPEKSHGSGFMSRILFVYEKDPNCIEPLTDVEDADINPAEVQRMTLLEQELKEEAKRIKQTVGPFTFTKAGREWFDQFYRGWANSPEGQGEGWPTRRPDHMLRVAMVLTISKQKNLEIDERSLMAADVALKQVESDFHKAFAYIGTTGTRDRERILDALARSGGSASSDKLYPLIYPFFQDIESIKRTLYLLREAGVITFQIEQKGNRMQEVWSLVGGTFKI